MSELLSVVIPCRDSSEQIKCCLESISRQKLGISLEVLIISNPSELRIKNVLEECISSNPQVEIRFLISPKASAASARNMGIQGALGNYIYLLDDDCVLPHPHFLEELLSTLKKSSSAAVGGPYLTPRSASYWSFCYNQMVLLWMKLTSLPVGGNCLYRNADLQGFSFSEERAYGGVETSLHLQMLESGKNLKLDLSLGVFHDSSANLLKLLTKAWWQGIAKGKLSRQYPKLKMTSLGKLFSTEGLTIALCLPYLVLHFIVMSLGSLKARWSP